MLTSKEMKEIHDDRGKSIGAKDRYKPKVSCGKVKEYRSKPTVNTDPDRIYVAMFMTKNDWGVLQGLIEQVDSLGDK